MGVESKSTDFGFAWPFAHCVKWNFISMQRCIKGNSISTPFAADGQTCVELLYKDIFNSSYNGKHFCLLKEMEILKFSGNRTCC